MNRTMLGVDPELLRKAVELSAYRSETQVVDHALRELIRQHYRAKWLEDMRTGKTEEEITVEGYEDGLRADRAREELLERLAQEDYPGPTGDIGMGAVLSKPRSP